MWNERKIDNRYYIDNRPVQVYKNLHRDCWSLRQKSLVKAHFTVGFLLNPDFIVKDGLRKEVLKNKVKNVHAWIEGDLLEEECKILSDKAEKYIKHVWKGCERKLDHIVLCLLRNLCRIDTRPAREITYNPYKYDRFVYKDTEEKVSASAVIFTPSSVFAV